MPVTGGAGHMIHGNLTEIVPKRSAQAPLNALESTAPDFMRKLRLFAFTIAGVTWPDVDL